MKRKAKKIAVSAAVLMCTVLLASCGFGGKSSSKNYSTNAVAHGQADDLFGGSHVGGFTPQEVAGFVAAHNG